MVKGFKKIFILFSLLTFSATTFAADINAAFSINLNLFAIITITKVRDLTFPDTTLTGSAFNIVVATGSSNAAAFNVTGTSSGSITRSIVESTVNMSTAGASGTIAVDTFIISGPTAFDLSGNANNILVGATAHVLASSQDGNYSGTGTLRVVYL